MSAIKQIQIGGGTTYDVNDLRVATSVVTTATHVLATNSAVSAINPIAMASLASVLGAQNNNGWTIRIQGQTSGSRFYKIYTSSNSMPFRFLGRGSANGRHTDTTIVIGNGVHEGYKGLAHGATGDTYLSYFYTDDGTQATLYVKTAGAIQARVISSMPMTEFEEINALPEGATEIVPISVPDAISTQNLSSLASALGAQEGFGWRWQLVSTGSTARSFNVTGWQAASRGYILSLQGCTTSGSNMVNMSIKVLHSGSSITSVEVQKGLWHTASDTGSSGVSISYKGSSLYIGLNSAYKALALQASTPLDVTSLLTTDLPADRTIVTPN